MTFGEKIFMLRKEKGMSQEEVASKLGVSRQAISRWELESVLPDVANVLELSKLFGVSIDYLLREDWEERFSSNEEIVDGGERGMKTQNAMIGLYVVLALHTFADLIFLYGYIEKSNIAMLTAIPLHFVILVSFEIGYTISKKTGNREFNPRLHIYYYMVAIWLVAYSPIWVVVTLLVKLYPRPYYGGIPELLAILLYFIVCMSVTTNLKKKL